MLAAAGAGAREDRVDDSWVCDNCKSINRARERRCYKCHGERAVTSASTGTERRAVEAVVSRSARDYLPTWPLAILAGTLLVAVSVMGVLLLLRSAADFPALRDAFVAAIYSGQDTGTGLLATQSAETAFLGLLRTGLVLLALVSFAAWLALATMNVPTLGGGVPPRSPVRVFIYTLIPVWNLFKVPGMVQDVLYRLDASAGGAWMVMAATIGLLGSWFLSWIGGWAIAFAFVGDLLATTPAEEQVALFSRLMDQSFWLTVVTELMITVGTLLLVVLMVRVEQRCAARNREIQEVIQELAAGPAYAPPAATVAPASPAAPGAPGTPVAPTTASPATPVVPAPAPMAPHGFQVVGRSPSEAAAPPPPPPPPDAPPA
jgi:hypothetical protein